MVMERQPLAMHLSNLPQESRSRLRVERPTPTYQLSRKHQERRLLVHLKGAKRLSRNLQLAYHKVLKQFPRLMPAHRHRPPLLPMSPLLPLRLENAPVNRQILLFIPLQIFPPAPLPLLHPRPMNLAVSVENHLRDKGLIGPLPSQETGRMAICLIQT